MSTETAVSVTLTFTSVTPQARDPERKGGVAPQKSSGRWTRCVGPWGWAWGAESVPAPESSAQGEQPVSYHLETVTYDTGPLCGLWGPSLRLGCVLWHHR